jgi:hypothetical protein
MPRGRHGCRVIGELKDARCKGTIIAVGEQRLGVFVLNSRPLAVNAFDLTLASKAAYANFAPARKSTKMRCWSCSNLKATFKRRGCFPSGLKLVSLYDMVTLWLQAFCRHLDAVRAFRDGVLLDEIKRGQGSRQFQGPHMVSLCKPLLALLNECKRIEMGAAAHKIELIRRRLIGFPPPCTYEVILTELQGLDDTISHDLKGRLCVYIRPESHQYLKRRALFGRRVNEKFSPAVRDIREAGNCIATELYTAAVFHLMRVAEHGLRALAKHLRVKLKKNIPLDYADWGTIVRALESKVVALAPLARGKKKESALDFYQGALLELRALKDVYRNKVSHCRAVYDEEKAKHAMRHVSALMRQLAVRLSEPK